MSRQLPSHLGAGAARRGWPLVVVLILSSCGGDGSSGTPTSPTGSTSSVRQGVCGYRVEQQQLIQSMGYEGGAITIAVTVTDAACSWTSESQAGFITVDSGAGSNRGNGQVQLTVARNDGAERTGTVVIAGVPFTVRQTPPPCQFRVTFTPPRFPDAGGTGTATVAVTQGVNCSWTATSEAAFITGLAPASGTGGGTVSFIVARNTDSAARSGVVRIAGEALTISQDGALPCVFSVASNTTRFGAGGGTGTATVAVVQGSNCSWTATSESAFITNVAPGGGTGNGTVTFMVDRNTGTPARSGVLRIAGQAITIEQDGDLNCTFFYVDPLNAGPAGDTYLAGISASDPRCTWTPRSTVPWITVEGATQRTGTGSIRFTIARNTGGPRVGYISIGNGRMTINQEGAPPIVCTFSFVETVNIGRAGDPVLAGVSASDPSCTWTPVSTVPWVTIDDPGQRTGTGSVRFTVAPNPGPPRVGYVTIGNQRMTFNQAGQQTGQFRHSDRVR